MSQIVRNCNSRVGTKDPAIIVAAYRVILE